MSQREREPCCQQQNTGSGAHFDGNNFINNYTQSVGTTQVGYDFSTNYAGAGYYTAFTNCFVWDLPAGKDGWIFNGICEVSLNGCVPDYNTTGVGVTNGKIVKNSTYRTFEDFFNSYDHDNESWQPLPFHSLNQSPCYPIIGTRRYNGSICYYCKLHPAIENVNLDSIEQHCKYQEPERHKAEIVKLMKLEEEK